MEPAYAWLSFLGAITAALACVRLIVLPTRNRERLESSVRAFARAVELRFPNHSGLTEVVVRLARRVGSRLGLGPRRLRDLELSVRLRDIGLCAIPYRLVNRRPWHEWSLSETSTYDCHSEVGGAILESIPALSPHAETVRNHHAPYRNPQDESDRRLPSLDARIVKACAEYVWHARHRGHEAAADHLRQGCGTLYDPEAAGEVLRLAKGRQSCSL